MENGKGWHLESRRHSEARLYGRASGSKQLKAPVPKGTLKVYDPKYASQGNTLFYRLPNGKYIRVGSSWKIGAYKNVKKQFDKLDEKEAEKKLSEVKKITPVKETPAQIEADYNAVSKPEYQTHKYDNKNVMGIDNTSTKDLITGTKVKAESKAELELQLNEAFPNYEKSITKVSDDIYNVKITRQKPRNYGMSEKINSTKMYKGKQLQVIFGERRKGQMGVVSSYDPNLKVVILDFPDGRSSTFPYEYLDLPNYE